MAEPNLVDVLATVELFSTLRPDELQTLAAGAEIKKYAFGETVFQAGDAGIGIYVIKSGAVRLFTEENGKEVSLGLQKAGGTVGEVAALRDIRHEFSARASASTELLLIPRAVLAPVLTRNPAVLEFMSSYVAIRAAGGFVTKLFDLGRKLDGKELEDLVRSIGAKKVRAGEVILEQDSSQDRRLYVVRQGKVSVSHTAEDTEFFLATLEPGETFGERAALLKQEQQAKVVAETDVILLVIPETTLGLILERNPKLREGLEERIQFIDRELNRQRKLAERRRRPVLLDLISKPKLGERLLKRFPFVEQAEQSDCGAACLAMICKHYNIPITLGKLRDMANVTLEGATLDSLARVGESLGFSTRGVKCTYQSLLGFQLPFIAHWEGYHYIVVYGVSKHNVWVADPAMGFRKLTVEEFERGWTGNCLVFTPGTNMVQEFVQQSPWLRFVGLLKPYKKVIGHLFLATLVIEVLGVVPPVIVQNVLDRVVVHSSYNLLVVLIVGLMLAHLFTQLASLLRAYLANYIVRNLDFAMMAQFFKHTLSLPVRFFATRRTGDILARFQENATIRQFLTQSTVSTILNLLMIFIYFIVLFMYNVKMTLLLLVLIVPMALLTLFVTPRIKAYAQRNFEASTDANALLIETLGGAETIKGMGIERAMRLKWERKYAKALDVQYRAAGFEAWVGFTSQMMHAITSVILLWVGANLVLAQELTIGQLIAFNMLMGSVLSPIMGLIGLWDEIYEVSVAMERLGDVLDLEPEQKPENLPSRILIPDLQGNIRFDGVYFRYGGKETPYVLENISFSMKAGELVAVVGQSGSGKTTLAKLLAGFYPPTDGTITVDGYDLNQIDKEYYRAQMGYVMQGNLLFSGSVAENIAMGEENPDRGRIQEVAKLADAHGFISNLPLGYEQVVGERGVGLSGGQVQRLCIARALYHDPRLLIFDEATSALDSQSESNILNNMREIMRGRGAVVIAHRLSTVMSADRILVLYGGNLVEQGTHQELIARRGMYHQLVQKQLGAE